MALYWEYQDTGATSFDDDTRTATEYDAAGQLIGVRPYTEAENIRADDAIVAGEHSANKSTLETNLDADLATMQAVIDQANADLRADPSQEIKDIARAARRLIKLQLEDYSEAE